MVGLFILGMLIWFIVYKFKMQQKKYVLKNKSQNPGMMETATELWGKSNHSSCITKWWLMHSDKMSNLPNYVHLDRLRLKILFFWLGHEVNLSAVHFVMPDSTNGLQSSSEQKPWHRNKCANDGQATLHFLSLSCSGTVSHIRTISK